jgi:predicted O-methyltransferase YrrM
MYSPVKMIVKYAWYYITASNGKGHGVHSPFLFDFIERVLNDDRQFYAFKQIENLRQLLLNNQQILEVGHSEIDPQKNVSASGTIAVMARSALMPAKFCQLLFRMVDRYAPSQILELGTSLGITSSYLAMANENASVTTMERSKAVADSAREQFKKLGIRNCRLIEGNIDEILPLWLKEDREPDMVLIDASRRYKPTMHYFRQLLEHINDNSILIFTGIHESNEMEQAWKEIQQDEAVTLSIDLFSLGIVLFRKEFRTKQHTSIRF